MGMALAIGFGLAVAAVATMWCHATLTNPRRVRAHGKRFRLSWKGRLALILTAVGPAGIAFIISNLSG